MSGPLRPCGREECRLCNPRPLPPPDDTLPELLVGAGAVILVFLLFAVLLPVLAG